MNAQPKGPRRIAGEALIAKGWRDAPIAKELSVSRELVRQWRLALGVPSKRPQNLTAAQKRMIRRSSHVRSEVLAQRFGCATHTVRRWRKKLNAPYVRVNLRRTRALAEVRAGKLPLETIAAKAGVHIRTLANWRSRAGLARLRRKFTPSLAATCAAALAEAGGSPKKASAATGLPPSTIKRWAERSSSGSEKTAPMNSVGPEATLPARGRGRSNQPQSGPS